MSGPCYLKTKQKLELTDKILNYAIGIEMKVYQDNRNHIEGKFDPSTVHKGDGNRCWPFVMLLVHPRV
jgi:hypothetical protein